MSANAEAELHQLLNENFGKMRDELEEFFRRSQQIVVEEQKEVYSPIVNKLQDNLEQKEEEFNEMNANAAENTNDLARKHCILQNMIKKCASLHRNVRDSNILSRAFHMWIEISNQDLLLSRRYKELFIKSALPRTYFRRWVRKMRQQRENRIESESNQIFEKESRSRANEYNSQIESLEKELAETRKELETKQKTFIEMQQKLRKAFMRGVVNLNLEAMDVFNGAQFMDMTQEVEGQTGGEHDSENEIEEGDDDFYVEESPSISVIRH